MLTPITEERKWVLYFVCFDKISINSRDIKHIKLVRCDAYLPAFTSAISTHCKQSHTSIINCFYLVSKKSCTQYLNTDKFNICDIKHRCFQQNK
jgi:hypothetical protein